MTPLPGRIRPSDRPSTSGRATASMAQIGGSYAIWMNRAPNTTGAPVICITNTAAPSPVFSLVKSKPQTAQRSTTLRQPA